MAEQKFYELKRRGKNLIKIAIALSIYCIFAVVFSISCPIKAITGISCPGCGMTRSVVALLRLDFCGAFTYHPLVFLLIVIVPLLTMLHLYQYDKACAIIMLSGAIILIAVYLYRMIVADSPILEFKPENGIFPRFYRWIFNWFC